MWLENLRISLKRMGKGGIGKVRCDWKEKIKYGRIGSKRLKWNRMELGGMGINRLK
jgi:hypothetical protein